MIFIHFFLLCTIVLFVREMEPHSYVHSKIRSLNVRMIRCVCAYTTHTYTQINICMDIDICCVLLKFLSNNVFLVALGNQSRESGRPNKGNAAIVIFKWNWWGLRRHKRARELVGKE